MTEKTFPKSELEDSLKRAFVSNKADFIIVDGQTLRSEFLRESINLGLSENWIETSKPIDEDETLGAGQGQYYAYTYRLTKKGKKYFGVNE